MYAPFKLLILLNKVTWLRSCQKECNVLLLTALLLRLAHDAASQSEANLPIRRPQLAFTQPHYEKLGVYPSPIVSTGH